MILVVFLLILFLVLYIFFACKILRERRKKEDARLRNLMVGKTPFYPEWSREQWIEKTRYNDEIYYIMVIGATSAFGNMKGFPTMNLTKDDVSYVKTHLPEFLMEELL